MILNWHTSKEDFDLIVKIAERARAIAIQQGFAAPGLQQDLVMDLTACHANGNPLRLAELLEADNYTLTHDVFGIAAHLDRDTGRLEGFFVPRCTLAVTQ